MLKICGITDETGRDICLECGVDIIGFNIYRGSRRYVEPSRLKELMIPAAAAQSAIVGVDMGIEEWASVTEACRPGYIQLHGSEEPALMGALKIFFPGVKIIRKVLIEEAAGFEGLLEYADFLLCDSRSSQLGGSGESFDWKQLSSIPAPVKKKLFVAGGITPENAREALSYGVCGVDAATGSEISPGVKSREKIEKFVKETRIYE